VRVHVIDRLAGLPAGIEDHAVSRVSDALRHCYVSGVGHEVCQQAVRSGTEVRQVPIVDPRDDKDVHRGLGVDIAECDRPRISGHYRRRYLTSGNAAEQAIRHGAILTSAPPGSSAAYIVALLRTPRCTTPLVQRPCQLLASVAQGQVPRECSRVAWMSVGGMKAAWSSSVVTRCREAGDDGE
jgi:hypothetical protein